VALTANLLCNECKDIHSDATSPSNWYCNVSITPNSVRLLQFLATCRDRVTMWCAGYWDQGCGAGAPISGSSSRHLNFFGSNIWKILAPALGPEWFGPLKNENHCIICTTRLPHEVGLWNRNPNFRLQLHHLKVFDSGCSCSHPKLLGIRISASVP